MSYAAKTYRVMIASPSDVVIERNIIREVITKWNDMHSYNTKIVLLPVSWETHAAPMAGKPQDAINKQVLHDSDILVGVFWTRIGTATEEFDSGTVEEIERLRNEKKPIMVYFSNAPVQPDKIDHEQYQRLKDYQKEFAKQYLYWTYDDVNEFKSNFERHLQTVIYSMESNNIISKDTDNGEITKSNIPDIPQISNEAQLLLIKAANSKHGDINRFIDTTGTTFQVNDKAIISGKDPRKIALWEHALEELLDNKLIKQTDSNGQIFGVTHIGFEIANLLKPDIPQLSKEAQILLKEAATSSQGLIMCLSFIGGMSIRANGKEFAENREVRERTKWEDAIRELENKGLILAQGYQRQSFKVTTKGYEIADLIEL